MCRDCWTDGRTAPGRRVRKQTLSGGDATETGRVVKRKWEMNFSGHETGYGCVSRMRFVGEIPGSGRLPDVEKLSTDRGGLVSEGRGNDRVSTQVARNKKDARRSSVPANRIAALTAAERERSRSRTESLESAEPICCTCSLEILADGEQSAGESPSDGRKSLQVDPPHTVVASGGRTEEVSDDSTSTVSHRNPGNSGDFKMKWTTLTAALLIVAGSSVANAGLFKLHRHSCCDSAPSCAAPCGNACGAPSCAAPCGSGCGNACAAPTCAAPCGNACAAAPSCCAPAASCCAPAPADCCAPTCNTQRKNKCRSLGGLSRNRCKSKKCGHRDSCCDAPSNCCAPTCAAPCGNGRGNGRGNRRGNGCGNGCDNACSAPTCAAPCGACN